MSLKASGKLKVIFEEQQINDSFKKREFVIETDEKYPQLVKFELIKDDCNLIDDYKEGDTIDVEFNLRGREWNEKYFTNLHAWRITGLNVAKEPPVEPVNAANIEGNNVLPF